MDIVKYLTDAKEHYIAVREMYLEHCSQTKTKPVEDLLSIPDIKRPKSKNEGTTVRDEILKVLTHEPQEISKIIALVKKNGTKAVDQTIRTQLSNLANDKSSGVSSPFRGVYKKD